jgi:hypothetical protein
MQTIAYNATLFQENIGVSGIAMRTTTSQVFFQADATGLWTELTNADAPRPAPPRPHGPGPRGPHH